MAEILGQAATVHDILAAADQTGQRLTAVLHRAVAAGYHAISTAQQRLATLSGGRGGAFWWRAAQRSNHLAATHTLAADLAGPVIRSATSR
jgi:hypothetical protein